jgi:hypothetical protein
LWVQDPAQVTAASLAHPGPRRAPPRRVSDVFPPTSAVVLVAICEKLLDPPVAVATAPGCSMLAISAHARRAAITAMVPSWLIRGPRPRAQLLREAAGGFLERSSTIKSKNFRKYRLWGYYIISRVHCTRRNWSSNAPETLEGAAICMASSPRPPSAISTQLPA